MSFQGCSRFGQRFYADSADARRGPCPDRAAPINTFPDGSGQTLAGEQWVAGEKVLRVEPSATLALEFDNAQRLLAAGNNDSAPARFQHLAWRTGT